MVRIRVTGANPGFQVRRGAHLKKLRRVEGGATLFGVFRVSLIIRIVFVFVIFFLELSLIIRIRFVFVIFFLELSLIIRIRFVFVIF
jgi:hypothetical protein